MNKVGEREVVQCLNDNRFLGLGVDVALIGSPIRCQIVRDTPNKTTNKSYQTLCIQTPKNATK